MFCKAKIEGSVIKKVEMKRNVSFSFPDVKL